ncbi:twin-arginine translocase subunit TatB [Marinomonas rhizomae]|uniref:Sec-independent protein translocase protein TatB n=1 Tax=Marinomonas rhizomae TaxID=491948 RepID=UPI0021020D17|nr:Sec-independent protein translocase protein TatB [Marinomonas rhizomae]UTV99015.1 twin-arginine translocase subunit TatB [Marinomonas rhizomae]
MFDIGFSELLVVFVVGLLILGPERLPHAAKTAGLWVRKIRRSISSVQREINAQLDHEELQQKINETNQRLLKEGQAIQNTITPYPEGYEAKADELEPVIAEPSKAEDVDTIKQEAQPSINNESASTDTIDSAEPQAVDKIKETSETAASRT